jgi:glutaredoxin
MQILIYSKDNCPWCDRAKELVTNKGFTYEEIKIGRDITREEFLEQFPNVRTVPYIFVGERPYAGYEELKEYLDHPVNKFPASF